MEFKIDVTVKGVRPLLQNAFADDSDGAISKKKQVYDDAEEAAKRIIRNEGGLICQPASHFEATMVKSATDFKFQGRKTYKDIFKAGIFVDPFLIPP